MMLIMCDKSETVVVAAAVTSISKDYDLLPPNGSVDTLVITIGSAVRKLTYKNSELRDLDYTRLVQGMGKLQPACG